MTLAQKREVKTDGSEASAAGLARHLIAFAAEFGSEPPGSVVLTDDSDAALAAALVATKMLIAVEATVSASDPASLNGRLIKQLAAA